MPRPRLPTRGIAEPPPATGCRSERSAVMRDVGVIIDTDIPARLDRLPWTRFHTLVVVALGITWVLDGLEVTIAGSIAGALEDSPVLHFTAAEIGLAASAYLAGAVSGALLFGYLTDRLCRRKLFMVTLGIYLAATAATALSWDFWSFAIFRVLTGAGIGGEYVAINSAIQELIPARYRGRTDLAINFLGISCETLYSWKISYPEFRESITRGKILADAHVAEALYRRACGYNHPAVKIF